MANVIVTAGGGTHAGANRVVVRSSGGTVYVVTNDAGNIQIFKGNAQPPTSFSEQEAAGAPDNSLNRGVAAAIDANDLIHVIYQFEDNAAHGAAPVVRYAQFRTVDHATTQDDWVLIDETVAVLDNSATDFAFAELNAIAIDANNIPHVAWNESQKIMGIDLDTISYANRIGGSWNTKVTVQQKTGASGINDVCDIIIADPASSVNADRPIIITDGANSETPLNAYHGTALNATAFTLAGDVAGAIDRTGPAYLAIDSAEKIVVCFIESTTLDLMIIEHLNSSAWGTWETPIDVAGSTLNWRQPSIAINGTDMYVFAVDNTSDDVHLWKDIGSGWVEDTTGDLPEAGTFSWPKAKWASKNNNEGTVQLDYVFEDASGIRWNKFVFSAATVVTVTHTTDSFLKAIRTLTHTTDSVLKALDQTVAHDTDSVLKAIDNETIHTTDSYLLVVRTLTHTTDSVLKALDQIETHTTDSVLKALDNEITHTTDSVLVSVIILTHTTDSVLKALDQTVSHDTDSVLKKLDNELSHTTDSFLVNIVTLTHTTDSVLKSIDNLLTHTTDSFLKAIRTLDHTTDSILKAIDQILTHDTDSVLKKLDNEITHTTDSVLGEREPGISITHTTDSVLKALDTEITHTTDSHLFAVRTLTHSTDSILKILDQIVTHTTDSHLFAVRTLTHTTDSILKKLDSLLTHTTDSFLVTGGTPAVTVTHNTDSVLKALDQTVSHTTDSFLALGVLPPIRAVEAILSR